MGLVDQIFQQAQLGTSQTPTANPFAEGVQLGQNQQRINLATQQLGMELAQQHIKQTLMQQENEMNAYKLQTMKDQRDAMVSGAANVAELAGQVQDHFAAGAPEKAEEAWWSALRANPKLRLDPTFQSMHQDINASIDAKAKLMELRYNRAPMVQSIDVPDEVGGGTHPVQLLHNSSGGWTPLPGQGATTEQRNTDAIERAQTAYNSALASGNPAVVEAARNHLTTLKEQTAKENETITTDPKTGAVTVTRGPQTAGLPTATASMLQQSLVANSQIIDSANRLEPLISNETVGLQAKVGSIINDQILAQRFPEMASQKRAQAETIAASLRAQVVNSLKDSGNVSKEERNQILEAVPEINEALDSPAHAKMVLAGTRKVAAIHSLMASAKLNQPIPPAAAQVLDAATLQQLYRSGVISQQTAIDSYRIRTGGQ